MHQNNNKKKVKTMQIEIKEMTPVIAASLLARNRSNRPLSKRHVDFLASQMKGGYFMETGDSIKVSKEGDLIDGQHRLTAIIQSGVAVKCVLATDVSRDVFEVLDTGKPRSASDVLAISGYKNSTALAATARMILTHEAGINSRTEKGAVHKNLSADFQSNKKLTDFVEQNKEALLEAVNLGVNAYTKCRFISASEYAMYYFVFAKKSQSDAHFFIEKLSSGAELPEKSPILLLRRILERNITSHVKLTQYAKKYYVVRAWNAFREKRLLTSLNYSNTVKMPEIV